MKLRIVIGLLLCLLSQVVFSAPQPLPADEAFQVSARILDPNTILLQWRVHPGYFLYKNRIHLTNQTLRHIQLELVHLPEGSIKTESDGDSYPIYRNELVIPVSILGIKTGSAKLQLEYQGCADWGFCYPPTRKIIEFRIAKTMGMQALQIKADGQQIAATTQTSKFKVVLESHNIFWIILSFLGFGVLLAFTPCVLPMIPVLSGVIVGHGHTITTRKAFMLSLLYVLSMSITYALVGVVLASLGSNIQTLMQNPWAISLFAALFVLLALSMFGLYDLQLPSSWQVALANISKRQHGGHYLSAVIMGVLSTLILSPCVTPPLVGVLTFIVNTGDVGLGAIALFSVSFGMGLPLLLIGTSGGKLLPKAGVWMNAVKAFFGVLLLGVAITLVARLLPGEMVLLLWALLFIVSGLCLGALKPRGTAIIYKFWQGVGLIAIIYGVLLVVGAGFGNQDPLRPLANILQTSTLSTNSKTKIVKSIADIEKAVIIAKQNGKPVMLDFYADWCVSCKIMEKTTFADPKVRELLQQILVLKADVTANDEVDKALQRHYQVIAPPTLLFFDTQGQLQPDYTEVGELTAQQLLKRLQQFLSKQSHNASG